MPPPRWFNKATGDYEDVKPMYFMDPANPEHGLIAPDKVAREDDAFRQFLEAKENRRRDRLERATLETRSPKTLEMNSTSAMLRPTNIHTNQTNPEELDIQEGSAQKASCDTAGKILSKRGASTIAGPGLQIEIQRKRELEQRYRALKPFVPEDERIEELAPTVNPEDVINAWRSSTLTGPPIKKRAMKNERQKAQELIKHKRRGSSRGSVWTFAAMHGSYCPPNAVDSAKTLGWKGEEKSCVERTEAPTRKWKNGELLTSPWWESGNTAKWKSKEQLREEFGGRLAINPATGKLEDIAPSKMERPGSARRMGMIVKEMEPEVSLLM